MFSAEEKAKALATLKKNNDRVTLTIRELGYPSRATLKRWKSDRDSAKGAPEDKPARKGRYSEDQARKAVEYYLGHGKSASATIKALGYPKSRQKLTEWIGEYAPAGCPKCDSGSCDNLVAV